MGKNMFLNTDALVSELSKIESFWENNVKTSYITDKNSLKIGVTYIEPQNPVHQLVIIPGRGETVHKYAEFLYCMDKSHIRTAVLSARGQGIADRLLSNRQKCHINNINEETSDIARLISLIGYKDYGLLAFSLGGLFAIDFILGNYSVNKPRRVALIAPFLWPRSSLNSMLLTAIAFIAGSIPILRETFTPYDQEYKRISFKDNYHSHCEIRYNLYHDYYLKHPEFTIGSPTWGFVKEVLLKQRQLAKIQTELPVPFFVQTAQNDMVVSSYATYSFFKKHCNDILRPIVRTIPKAYHDVLNETDNIRSPALNGALDFLFGV